MSASVLQNQKAVMKLHINPDPGAAQICTIPIPTQTIRHTHQSSTNGQMHPLAVFELCLVLKFLVEIVALFMVSI